MRTVESLNPVTRGNIYTSIRLAGSGMSAQRRRMDAIASNIANIDTTNVDGAGAPYQRQAVVMSARAGSAFQAALSEASLALARTDSGHMASSTQHGASGGVTPMVQWAQLDIPNMLKNVVYDPAHPDADPQGFVTMPDINMLEEMTDLMIASRAFDANITVIDAAKSMITRSLEI